MCAPKGWRGKTFSSVSNSPPCGAQEFAMIRNNWNLKSASTAIKDDVSFELNYSLRYVRWLLRVLGVWPLLMTSASRFEKNVAKGVRPMAMLFMILVIVPMLAEVILQRADTSELLVLVAPIAYQSSNFIKHIFMIFRADVIRVCTDHMAVDWKRIGSKKDRETMMKNIRKAHTVAIVMTSSILGSSTLYNFIVPLFADSTTNELNETIRALSYPGGDIFLDVQARFIYEIVFLAYYLSALSVVFVHLGLLNLTLMFVCHSCGLIQIIESNLESLDDPNVQEVFELVEKSVAIVIHDHARLIKFSTYVEKALREICLLEVVGTTMLICFLEYCCVREWATNDAMAISTYASLVFSMSFNLFVYCQIGEVLKEQCQNVGKAAYMIEWYKLPGKSSLVLVMIMSMSAKPRHLTAGGMMEISRFTFANLMKTSFAYLNMLRTVV